MTLPLSENTPKIETLDYLTEEQEWAQLSPAERYLQSLELWNYYVSMGGSLDPAPDSQSPFDCEELQRAVSPDKRSGVHFIRRR